MLENIIYKNHLGEVVELNGKTGIFCNNSDLRDFCYEVATKNARISSFSRGVVSKTLPVVIACTSEEAGIRARHSLFETMEKDVLARQHGCFIVGDYYMKCFVIGSEKSEYHYSKRYMCINLIIQTDFPYWIKETKTTFGYSAAASAGNNLDFNGDFPMDYTSNMLGKTLDNSDFVASNFRMVMYGAAENPSVTVGGHLYSVDCSMGSNEYITIDSVAKTIILTHKNGTTENLFNARNRDSYIFEKIPVGLLLVELSGCIKADITLLEERSEPKWI